jgi:hypothetical protein
MLVSGASVSLTIPAHGFVDVARRVLGGAAGATNLGFDAVDDVQLALELVLRSGVVMGDSATITIAPAPTGLTLTVREVDTKLAARRLCTTSASGLALGDALSRIVDDVSVTREPVPELVLHKTVSQLSP